MNVTTITALGTIITASLAILSPVVTTIANNIYINHKESRQFEYNERYMAVKNFFTSFGKLNGQWRYEDKREFSEATALLILFSSNQLKTELNALLIELAPSDPNLQSIIEQFTKCSTMILKEFNFQERKRLH